jgi:hypothetical protein
MAGGQNPVESTARVRPEPGVFPPLIPYGRSMAVRPPQQDGDEPDSLEFGIAALSPYLSNSDLTFPATTDEIVRALGDPEIPYDANDNTVALSEALAAVGPSEFDSKRELLDALHPVFEEYRASGGGIFSQLRALLPF